MHLISKKKAIYAVKEPLREYLDSQMRERPLPLAYSELGRHANTFTLYDSHGEDTLWETVVYSPSDSREIYEGLKHIYTLLKVGGDDKVMEHLFIDRVDTCTFANTKPYRVRIVNRINDNFDYFYIKKADASRIYGLELENMLSPNRVNFIVNEQTLIEEHIIGIPGDQFIKEHLHTKHVNEIRLVKEFVKFNERCFLRLLGDMHSSNFVVDITPDFDNINYRIRAIDFDQQSYEGKGKVYMPKYFKENNAIIKLGLQLMTRKTMKQYQREELSLAARRITVASIPLKKLIRAMCSDTIAPPQNVKKLGASLSQHYKNKAFEKARNMGQLVKISLLEVLKNATAHL